MKPLDTLYQGARKRDANGVCCWHDVFVNETPLGQERAKAQLALDSYVFEWGHYGHGARCLAFAILLDFTNDSRLAIAFHQEFKNETVAGWGESWSIEGRKIQLLIQMWCLRTNYLSDDPDVHRVQ